MSDGLSGVGTDLTHELTHERIHELTDGLIAEVSTGLAAALAAELYRQQQLWGRQHHPSGAAAVFRPLATIARWWCDHAAARGRKTWRHILLGEVLEALAEHHDARRDGRG